jgi:protein-tyrosine phosphatase
MIDIHSHILPGLDDGSHSMRESVAMLRIAARSGTTDIVATPHANLEYTFDEDQITEKLAKLREKVGPEPRIHRGCDFHLSFDNIEDAVDRPTKYTINHHNYLLVEFSDYLIFNNTGEIFDHLLAAGMTPIITHPERNYLLHQRMKDLDVWADKGVLLQVTALSFLGRFGRSAKRFAETLMEKGMVDFVASDAHDPEDRTPDMAGAYQFISHQYGEEWARRLFVTNPGNTLSGEPIRRALAEPPVRRKWYKFWG